MNKLEIVLLAQNFVSEFDELKIRLDYSLESLNRLEEYLTKTIKDSKPVRGSFFFENTDYRVFALGAYLGEVIRRNSKAVRWNTENAETPVDIIQETPDGSKALTINKAFKRVYNGPDDNIHHFAAIMLRELLKYSKDIPSDFFDPDDVRMNGSGDSPVAIYSKSIIENGGIVHQICHENGIWYFLGRDEDSNVENENYVYLFLHEVQLKHPEFAGLLEARDRLRIIRQDDGSYRPQLQHTGLFYDSHTIPSYQGDMKLDIIQWTRYNFRRVSGSLLAVLIGFILMIRLHWLFSLVFIGAALYAIWYWIMAYNRFKGGDVNPGKVISLNPTLVAVATDMRKSGGDYPVLKIIKTRLPQEDNVTGKIVPTVALYNDNPHGYPFWAEFHPVPVIHGIRNRNKINQILESFSKSSLDTLEDYIRKVNFKDAGIYKVDEENNSWSDFKHVDISKGVAMEKPLEPQNSEAQ